MNKNKEEMEYREYFTYNDLEIMEIKLQNIYGFIENYNELNDITNQIDWDKYIERNPFV